VRLDHLLSKEFPAWPQAGVLWRGALGSLVERWLFGSVVVACRGWYRLSP
jgi:hypothetical protein